jgi:signal transduction histidine kinase/ligand-binding sensor domain-containing protein/ActR/RegA family two-component response regulator
VGKDPSLRSPPLSIALIAGLVAVALSALGESPPDVFDASVAQRTWTIDDGLPQTSVTSIAADPQGFLWLATQGGVVRFDGRFFADVPLFSGGGFTSPRFTALAIGPDGSVWIGNEAQGLARWKDGRIRERYALSDSRRCPVKGLAFSADGDLLVAASWAGIFRFGRDGFHSRLLLDATVSCVDVAPDGTIWAGTWGNGLARIKNDRVSWIGHDPPFDRPSVSSILIDRDGVVWAGGESGELYQYANDELDIVAVPGPGSDQPIAAIAQAADGTVWTGGRGIAKWDGTRLQRVTTGGPADRELILSLFPDSHGNLWIGTRSSGVTRMSPGLFTSDLVPSGTVTTAVCRSRDDAVWVSAGCEGLYRVSNGIAEHLAVQDDLVGCSWSLYPAGDDGVYVGTWGNGLFHVRPDGTAEPVPLPLSARPGAILSLLEDSAGSLWVGTDGDGLLIVDPSGNTQQITSDQGLPADTVLDVHAAPDGSIWVGTILGIARVTAGTIVEIPGAAPLTDHHCRAIYFDREERAWIGTYGGGLAVLTDGDLRWIRAADGLPEDIVSWISEDEHGSLWLTGNRGVHQVLREDLVEWLDGDRPRFHHVTHGPGSGLTTIETNPGGWQDPDGRLWFPTVNGVTTVNPSTVPIRNQRPSPIITGVLIDGILNETDAITVPPGRHALEIRYTAIDYSHPNNLQFRFRLVGFDDAWNHVGDRRVAYFNHVPPGKYAFEVQASHFGGAWDGPVSTLSLVHRPRLHETRMATFIGLLVVVAVVALAVRTRTAMLRTRTQRLAEIIRQRTDEIQRLEARARATERMESLQALTGGLSHRLNNALMTVLGGLDQIAAGEHLSAQARTVLNRVRGAAQGAADLAGSLRATSAQDRFVSEPVDMAHVVVSTLDILQVSLRSSTRLIRDLADAVPIVAGDPSELRQLVTSLVINSNEAIPSTGGRITVGLSETAVDPRPRSARSADPSVASRFVVLTVEDTGSGMDKDVLAHACEPMFTTKETGRGLGLSTATAIVRRHSGWLHLDSQPGEGTTARVVLPADAPVAPAVEIQAVDEVAPAGGLALVVDDDPGVLETVSAMVEGLGFATAIAEDGIDAVARFQQDPAAVALAVIDLTMPRMGGMETAERLRALRPDLPIVLMSGFTVDEVSDREGRGPWSTFISKPFRADQLQAAVSSAMSDSSNDRTPPTIPP